MSHAMSLAPQFFVPGLIAGSQLGMRTTIPMCIFDGSSQFGLDSFYFNDSTTGSGAVAFNANSFVRLSCTTTSGDQAIRQSKPYMPYRVGRTLFVNIGSVMGAKKSDVRQRIGLFDANNGYFFEQDSADLKVVSRTNSSGAPVDTVINQSAWNIDVMDGSGRSAVDLDTSKFQQFIIEFAWGGIVRFGFLIDGHYHPCHEIYTCNILTDAGIARIFLPLRAEITNTDTAASGTNLDLSFMSAFLEDGLTSQSMAGSASITAARTLGGGATVPLISIRLKSAFSRGSIMPLSITFAQTGTFRASLIRLVYGGSLTGAAFASASNGVEFDVAATVITGGTVLYGSFIQSVNQPDIILPQLPPASSNFAGTSDIISISAFNLTGSSAATLAGINWRELV